MFESLAVAIEETDVPPTTEALTTIVALQDRLQAKVLAGLGEFDADDTWAFDGDASLTAWLRHHTGRSTRDAAHLARSAKLLRRLPLTAAAHADGRLSGGQLDAILANVAERTVDRFAAHEADLLPCLVPLPTVDVATSMQVWRARAEAELDEHEPPESARELFLSPSLDRRWHGSLALDDEGGTVLATAVRLATAPDVDGDESRTPARKRADALVDVARFYLDHQQAKPGGGTAPTSTWWCPSTTSRPVARASSSTAGRCPHRHSKRCCATAPCIAWWSTDRRPSSTTAGPRRPCPPRCSTPWCSETSTAGIPAATGPPPGAMPIT